MLKDDVLSRVLSENILRSYLNDLIRMYVAATEKTSNKDNRESKRSIEFVSQWLLLIDDNDNRSSLEYKQNDLLSVYSACCIIDRLEPIDKNEKDQLNESHLSYYINLLINQELVHDEILEKLFKLMFNHLWNKLCTICSTDEKSQEWVHTYSFISTYYPYEKIVDAVGRER
ncbi:unnamed protein product, partial [Rotaria sp. Silwood2]